MILPIFVADGIDAPTPIASMPGVSRFPVKGAVHTARQAQRLGIGGVLVFGVPGQKDLRGSEASAVDGIAQEAVAAIKADTSIPVVTDLCLCGYTSHGHCGVLNGPNIDLPATLSRYGEIAVAQARAGAD
ncbi:MAG TPA: porphobilinogen synthase, partial [Burkholderiales bacterium]|nr:porphobilinogen synthase [Burkholderiales bacterium]